MSRLTKRTNNSIAYMAIADFEDNEELIETCNACEKEYNPAKSGGIVNGHNFCQECLEGMATESAKIPDAIELLKEFAFYCLCDSTEDHCAQAVKVQEFLKNTAAAEWLQKQLEIIECDGCSKLESCKYKDGSCGFSMVSERVNYVCLI